MVVSCLMAYKTERSNYNPVWLFSTYMFIVVFWSVRYGIGYDYGGYMEIYSAIKYDRLALVEPGYRFINWLFLSSETGYIGVMFVMAALSYFFLFRVFVRWKILFYGVFFSLAFQFQFMIASQMRQALVIAAFLYAFRPCKLLKKLEQNF